MFDVEHALLRGSAPITLRLPTLAALTFVGSWNGLHGPSIVVKSPIVVKSDETRTLFLAPSAPPAGHYVMSWPLLMAGASFVVIPVLAVYLFAQRHFVEGIALGGLKG